MELIDFIINNKPLHSKPVLQKFIIRYKYQNNGLMDDDILKFIKKYNRNIRYLEMSKTPFVKMKKNICYLVADFNYFHTYVIYNNELYNFPVQHSSNHCSLYAGIICAIRPYVKDYNSMIKILKKIEDKKDTQQAYKLADISEYFFHRGYKYFVYKY